VGAAVGPAQLAQRAAFEDREAVAAFEAPPRFARHRSDEGGRGQRTRLEQGIGDDVELVPVEGALGLVEGRRACQLPH
jgi:hypothetical protein